MGEGTREDVRASFPDIIRIAVGREGQLNRPCFWCKFILNVACKIWDILTLKSCLLLGLSEILIHLDPLGSGLLPIA